MPGPEPNYPGNDLAAVGHQHHRGMDFVPHAIDGDHMQAALNAGDESETGGNVGAHSPATLVLGQGCGHHPGVVPGSAGHGEVLVSAGAFHATQIQRIRPGAQQCPGRARR